MDNNKKIALLIDLQKAAKDNFIVETLNKLDNGEFIANLWVTTVQNEINTILGDNAKAVVQTNALLDTLNRVTETPVITLLNTLINRLDNPATGQQVSSNEPIQQQAYVVPAGQRNAYLNPSRGNPLV